jgi:hypothetical protein
MISGIIEEGYMQALREGCRYDRQSYKQPSYFFLILYITAV